MDFRRFGIATMGIVMLAGSARATISYQASQASFNTKAGTDGLVVSSLGTFTGALTTDGIAANDEYVDATTQIEFQAFNADGSNPQPFTLTGGTLSVTPDHTIKITFPVGVDFGFAFNFTTTSTFETLCEDVTLAGCSGSTLVFQNASGFLGATNDIPTPAALTVLWVHQGNSVNTLQSFDVATQTATPDGPPMLLIGGGLIVLHLLHRRRRAIVAD
jgi:hypothetical protein